MQSGAKIKNTSPSFFGKKKQKIPLSLHEPSTMYSNAKSAKISFLSFCPQKETKTPTGALFAPHEASKC